MMASEFARHLFDVYGSAEHGALHEVSTGAEKNEKIRTVLDKSLQEVREVLDVTGRRKLPDGPCWCKTYMPTLGHTEDCQRARQLAERLRVG